MQKQVKQITIVYILFTKSLNLPLNLVLLQNALAMLISDLYAHKGSHGHLWQNAIVIEIDCSYFRDFLSNFHLCFLILNSPSWPSCARLINYRYAPKDALPFW